MVRTKDNLNSTSTNQAPSTLQIRIDPDTSAPIYVGYAVMGESSSADVWTIYKLTYSGSEITTKQTALGSWDNRTLYTYS